MWELERLLNILCEKWWKPRWFKLHWLSLLKNEVLLYLPNRVSCYKKLRELVSIESGLWQFCVENGMVKEQKEEKLIEIYDNLRWRTEVVYDDEQYQYRLIESSLKDESELEEFLLSNIVIKDE